MLTIVHDWVQLHRLIRDLRERGVEVDDSARRRSEYSYDASNYRVAPVAVAFPRDIDEIREIIRRCAEIGVPVITRGGGTSMAGNAVGEGVIVDVSRYMKTIREIDLDACTATVDAGVILGELRAEVERRSEGTLTFAPDPSSMSRATVGGSVANDACGNHSVAHGRMTHHVYELELVTADGAYLRAGPDGVDAVDADDAVSVARAQTVNGDLAALVQTHLAAIRTELETIPRQVSGYHLGGLLPEHGFDVARALAGSEGTCAIVVSARVRLVRRPRATALLCLGYRDTVDSARDVTAILAANPTAVEALDSSIVEIMRHRRGEASVDLLPEGDAYLLVEFSADDLDLARQTGAEVIESLQRQGRLVDGRIIVDAAQRAKLWRVREDGAGLSSRRIDGVQTWPGWEDSAVAPDRLADYLAELLPLVRAHGYTAFMYGHFGAGCVHMRLDYDLRSPEGLRNFEDFTRAAAALVVAHGGSLSGEHGDGRARSELLSVMYSPQLMRAFSAFKDAWDPRGVLNPGIIVKPESFTQSLALEGLPMPEAASVHALASPTLRAGMTGPPTRTSPFVGNTHACIGVGRCRASSGSVMCPSYRATKDEKDSTRGRARVLQEFVRNHGSSAGAWADPDVREALDLCLSCKACSTDCPTGVDIAEAKSTLIDEHYRGHVRPFTHYSIGWLPRWLPGLTRIAALANMGARSTIMRRIGDRFGVSALRRLPAFISARQIRGRIREARFADDGSILIFADSFTKAFRPEVIPAAARVLRDAGEEVGCTRDACCGLTWISTGQRSGARRRLSRLIERFDDGTDRPIVVLEPSCAAAIRDEGPKLVGGPAAERVAARVRSFSVAIAEALARGWTPTAAAPDQAVLQTHCHEHAVFGADAQRSALGAWGVSELIESSSCCGVAGNFGFESEHFETSMRVAEHSLRPAIEAASDSTPILTDGFSCAMQVGQLHPDRASCHLATLMDPSGESAARA